MTKRICRNKESTSEMYRTNSKVIEGVASSTRGIDHAHNHFPSALWHWASDEIQRDSRIAYVLWPSQCNSGDPRNTNKAELSN